MKKITGKHIGFLLFALVVVALFFYATQTYETYQSSERSYLSGCEYLPSASSDYIVITEDRITGITDSSAWISYETIDKLSLPESGVVWLRALLPDWKGERSSIYIGQINYGMEVYLKDSLIYRIGEFSTLSASHEFIGWNQNLIQLPDYRAGDPLYFRICLGKEPDGFRGKVIIGSSFEILKDVFVTNIDDLAFAFLFFVIGISALFLYFRFDKMKLLLGITLFLIPLAAFIISNSLFMQFLFPAPKLYYTIDYISFVSATIGGIYAIGEILGAFAKKIIKGIWMIHLLFLLGMITAIEFCSVPYLDVLNYFLILLLVNISITLILMLCSSKSGGEEVRMLIRGMIIFFLFAMMEILFYFYFGLYSDLGFNMRLLHLGVFAFVLSLIAIAIYNYKRNLAEKEEARDKLLAGIKRENEAKSDFTRRLIESQETERNRIALELHDSVGQKLLLIKNKILGGMKRSSDNVAKIYLNDLSELTGETIEEIRALSGNLRPQHLDQLGLTCAIETLLETIDENTEIRFVSEIDDIDSLLPKENGINFYRIIQESLNNIIKHSRATEVKVTVRKKYHGILLMVEDNGTGLKSIISNGGIGVRGMKERGKMLGGELRIESSAQGGTVVSLLLEDLKPSKEAVENE